MFLLVVKLVIPSPLPPCLVYYRGQRYLTRGIFLCGMLLRCAVGSGESAYGDLRFQCCCLLTFTGFAGLRGCFSADVLRSFQASFGLLYLGDCFCAIITCHYCFFCVYFFNVVHVFCVMKNSSNGVIFYCVTILTAICFNTVKIEKLE